MNHFLNEAANVFLCAAAILMIVFGFAHGRTDWAHSKMGVHNMTTTIVVVLVLALNAVQVVFNLRLSADAPWIRTSVYGLIFAWALYRLILFAYIRRHAVRGEATITALRRSSD